MLLLSTHQSIHIFVVVVVCIGRKFIITYHGRMDILAGRDSFHVVFLNTSLGGDGTGELV